MPSATSEAAAEDTLEATAGERLRTLRRRRGMATRTLAEMVGAPEVTVRAHENGQNNFGTERAVKYAVALGTTAEWLLLGLGEDRSELSDRIFAGLAERGHHFAGFTVDRAVFYLFDLQRERIIELERREQSRSRLAVVQ